MKCEEENLRKSGIATMQHHAQQFYKRAKRVGVKETPVPLRVCLSTRSSCANVRVPKGALRGSLQVQTKNLDLG